MTKVMIAGKFDPLHDGHADHIKKASQLGPLLYIATHTDEVVAQNSDKGTCYVPLGTRVDLIRGLCLLYGINGKVVIAEDYGDTDGTVAQTLAQIKPDIFAKGGDRTDSGKMPKSEVAVCAELGIEVRYGVGDLLNRSSGIVRASNQVYTVKDFKDGGLVLSVTHLGPYQQTKGHSHPNTEVYYFTKAGKLIVDDKELDVVSDTFTAIPSNVFHQVVNTSPEVLSFICAWREDVPRRGGVAQR